MVGSEVNDMKALAASDHNKNKCKSKTIKQQSIYVNNCCPAISCNVWPAMQIFAFAFAVAFSFPFAFATTLCGTYLRAFTFPQDNAHTHSTHTSQLRKCMEYFLRCVELLSEFCECNEICEMQWFPWLLSLCECVRVCVCGWVGKWIYLSTSGLTWRGSRI